MCLRALLVCLRIGSLCLLGELNTQGLRLILCRLCLGTRRAGLLVCLLGLRVCRLDGVLCLFDGTAEVGELRAQGAGFGVCRLGGVLCLLGELHRNGTRPLGPLDGRLCRPGVMLGTLAFLALGVQLAAEVGELRAQGAGFGVCRLGGVLCLLGELHRNGTRPLGFLACRPLVGELAPELYRLGVCRLCLGVGDVCRLLRCVGFAVCRLGFGFGPRRFVPCCCRVASCCLGLGLCRLDGGPGVERAAYAGLGVGQALA
ncbi:hypothetical protein [Streptomyces sp. HUAS TT7]|uniref:hypothetical protein n=1 Tax=Streptomyces sp. HUAS TT7 TaxID=3447507 RepID=UPI003F658CA0